MKLFRKVIQIYLLYRIIEIEYSFIEYYLFTVKVKTLKAKLCICY
jgi:hypothetical protein